MPKPHTTKVGGRKGNAALAIIDQHNRLPLMTAPVRFQDGEEPHPLVRQWRILKLFATRVGLPGNPRRHFTVAGLLCSSD